MRTRIAVGLLCVALLISMFVNYRFFLVIERQRNLAPISEWMTRLDINHITIVESGNDISDRLVNLIQQAIYVDILRIKEQQDLNPGRFGQSRVDRFESILNSLNEVRNESPDLFAPPKINMTEDRLENYVEWIEISDR